MERRRAHAAVGAVPDGVAGALAGRAVVARARAPQAPAPQGGHGHAERARGAEAPVARVAHHLLVNHGRAIAHHLPGRLNHAEQLAHERVQRSLRAHRSRAAHQPAQAPGLTQPRQSTAAPRPMEAPEVECLPGRRG